MAESSFNKSFGMNVKSNSTLINAAGLLNQKTNGVLSPLFTYLEENENVFTGDVAKEINRYYSQCFNIGAMLQEESAKTNGGSHRFDSKF